MNFLKKNGFLILIILLAIFLRVNPDIFAKGYIFDEIAMVSIAKSSFPFEILKNCAKLDYHAPLYYFVIHFLTYFKNEWLFIRILNIVFSVLNVAVFYLIGKNLKNKKLGLILALALAVNHMQISTVAFVKFYCMDFLLVSLNLIFLIKSIKKAKYLKFFGLVNILLILGFTFGFVFVAIEYLILFLYKKEEKRELLKSAAISFTGFLIYFPVLISQIHLSFSNLISPHGTYPDFSPFGIYAVINDYFSPLINYSCAEETVEANALLLVFLKKLIEAHKVDPAALFGFLFLSLFPVLISIYGILKSAAKKCTKIILFSAFLYILFFIILTFFKITGLISIYLFCSGICLIICAFSGLFEIKNKKISAFLIFYLIFTHLIVTNYYPQDKREISKLKNYLCPIKYVKNYKDDTLILTLGGRFLEKYLTGSRTFVFDYEAASGSWGRDFIKIIYGDEIAQEKNTEKAKVLLENFILNDKKSPTLEKYIKENLTDKMKKGEKAVYIFWADDCPFIANKKTTKEVFQKKITHLTDSSLLFQLKEDNETQTISETYFEDVIRSYSNKLFIEILEKNLKRKNVTQYRMAKNGDYYQVFSSDNFNRSTLWLMENVLFGWIFVTYQKE